MTDGLVHVPTMAELYDETPKAAERVVTQSGKKQSVSYRPTPEGQQRITDAMLHNGEYLRTHPEVSRELTREMFDKQRSTE